MIRRIYCNVYVCILNMQHVNKTPAYFQYYFKWASYRTFELKNYIKILKWNSDDELGILENNSYFGCFSSFNKAKNDS